MRSRKFAEGALLLLGFLACLLPSSARAGLLVSTDFSGLPQDGAEAFAVSGNADLTVTNSGTIDRYLGTPGQALTMTVGFVGEYPAARAELATGQFSVTNSESDLAKLTLGFDLCVSLLRPVRVTVESCDAAGKSTGSRTATVVPPVAGSFYRFGLDLDQTTPLAGAFDPLAPKVRFVFSWSDADGPAPLPRTAGNQLTVDNLSYTAPSFYVSPKGSDRADGRTAATAFATVQHAVDATQPGDVVLLMDGTFTNTTLPDISTVPKETVNAPVWRPWWVPTTGGICRVAKAGTPAAWIVIRNAPGAHPRLFNETGWEACKIDLGAAYVELRGLTLQGNAPHLPLADAQADSNVTERGGWRFYGSAIFNGNGIMVDGRATTDPARRAHHLRFIGNTVSDFPAAGIAAIGADYVTVAGNTVHDNVHLTRWGASGISFLRASNFDESTGHKMFVVGNRTYRNRCYVPWVRYQNDAQGNPVPNAQATRSTLSDGNGIIIDVNRHRGETTESAFDRDYVGRTLVSNNLSDGNGGGGIVITTAQHVDIVNNTLSGNVQTPDLAARGWGDLMLGGPPPGCGDIVVVNNIVRATSAKKALMVHRLTQPQPLLIKNNLFFGGEVDASDWPQIGNLNADPLFVDAVNADFHLRADSPANQAGTNEPARLVPVDDLEARMRRGGGPPTLGAYDSR